MTREPGSTCRPAPSAFEDIGSRLDGRPVPVSAEDARRDADRWYVLEHKWDVPCARCKAAVGEPCLTRRGRRTLHEARKRAVLAARAMGDA